MVTRFPTPSRLSRKCSSSKSKSKRSTKNDGKWQGILMCWILYWSPKLRWDCLSRVECFCLPSQVCEARPILLSTWNRSRKFLTATWTSRQGKLLKHGVNVAVHLYVLLASHRSLDSALFSLSLTHSNLWQHLHLPRQHTSILKEQVEAIAKESIRKSLLS